MSDKKDEIKDQMNIDDVEEDFDVNAIVEELMTKTRDYKGTMAIIITIIAVSASIFHLYTAYRGAFFALTQRSVHWMFMSVLIFLLYPANKKESVKNLKFYDVILALISIAGALYILLNMEAIFNRAGAPTTGDIVFGLIMVLIVLEATRRVIGLILPVVAIIALAYAYFGQYMPGLLKHKGYSLTRIFPYQFLTTEGIYGIPLGVSATFVYLFILFGAFLEKTGAGRFFIDLALSLTGSTQGGPAKASIVSSSLFGTVSGSSVANVVGTGTFTIPLMKSIGYEPSFAGAVEAASSTGGQIMPPIMGAAAFIMAENLGISYLTVAGAALIPALLYYVSLFGQVHFRAGRRGLSGIPKDQLPDKKEILKKGWHLLLPLVVLIGALVRGYSPMKAVFWTIIITVILSFIKKETRMTPMRFIDTLEAGARTAVEVAAASACAGIIVGVITMTGLGLKLAGLVVAWSGGILPLALILTMIASIILGLGLPTTAKYIILATLAAPALIQLGVAPIASHLFILYFGVIADITPPVALASYAAAGVAGADPIKTGLAALKVGLAAFIIPFIFVYHPSLLLIGTVGEIITASITSVIGAISLAAGLQGWFIIETKVWERILFLVMAFLLIKPGIITDFIGIGGLITIALVQSKEKKKAVTSI